MGGHVGKDTHGSVDFLLERERKREREREREREKKNPSRSIIYSVYLTVYIYLFVCLFVCFLRLVIIIFRKQNESVLIICTSLIMTLSPPYHKVEDAC